MSFQKCKLNFFWCKSFIKISVLCIFYFSKTHYRPSKIQTSTLQPSLPNNFNKLCCSLHTFRDRLRHGYSCVFSFLRFDWGLVGLIPFIPLRSVLFQASLELKSPTPIREQEGPGRRMTPLRSPQVGAVSGRARQCGEKGLAELYIIQAD